MCYLIIKNINFYKKTELLLIFDTVLININKSNRLINIVKSPISNFIQPDRLSITLRVRRSNFR